LLPRHLRLRHPNDFQAVRQHGQTWQSGQLVLSRLPNQLGHNRYGFIVSKRVGNAVIRNRVKRRLRALVHSRIDKHRPGHDIVIIARPSAARASTQTMGQTLAQLEKRAGLVVIDS
jgi:ribonuclease P protein component